jgi:hypothetical protein
VSSRRVGLRVVGLAVAAWTLFAQSSFALAQSYPGGSPPPDVGGQEFFPGDEVPRTGADIRTFVALALLALLIGLALHRISRRAAQRED